MFKIKNLGKYYDWHLKADILLLIFYFIDVKEKNH